MPPDNQRKILKKAIQEIIQPLYCVICAVSVLSACTFDPGENFEKISPSPAVILPSATLKTLDLMTLPDTFLIFERTTNIDCSFQFENEAITLLKIYIDGKILANSDKKETAFSIQAPNYIDGYHTIQVQAFTNSGTGSLADELGNEVVQWKREWTFFIKRIQPPLLKVLEVAPHDGRLRISWESSAIKTGKIVKLEYIMPLSLPITWSYVITDPDQTELIDSVFIEGKLKVTLTNQSIDPVISSPVHSMSVDYSYPDVVDYSSNGYGSLTIKCNRSLFYNNVTNYSFAYKDIVKNTSSSADTAVTFDEIPFFEIKLISLKTIPKNLKNDSGDPVAAKVFSYVSLGTDIGHTMSYTIYAPLNPQVGFSIDRESNVLHVLEADVATASFPLDTLQFTGGMTIGNDGMNLFLPYNGRIIRIDRSGNATVVLDTKLVYGQKIDIGNLSLGADRYLSFDNGSWNNNNGVIYVYDLKENAKIVDAFNSNTTFGESILMRSDAKYLMKHLSSNILYTLNNGNIVSSKTLGDSMGSFFNTAGDNKIILASAYQITIFDPETDQSVTKNVPEFTMNYYVEICYDPIKGNIGFRLNGYFYLIDPLTATVLRKIPVDNYNNGKFTMHNGNLYFNKWKYDFHL